MLDNVGDMILMTGLLIEVFGFPREFVLTRMIPGTAVGVLVGDLIFTAMAFRLARRIGPGRRDGDAAGAGHAEHVRLGLPDPGSGVRGGQGRGLDPEAAARQAWFVGIAMILASGVFKLACARSAG